MICIECFIASSEFQCNNIHGQKKHIIQIHTVLDCRWANSCTTWDDWFPVISGWHQLANQIWFMTEWHLWYNRMPRFHMFIARRCPCRMQHQKSNKVRKKRVPLLRGWTLAQKKMSRYRCGIFRVSGCPCWWISIGNGTWLNRAICTFGYKLFIYIWNTLMCWFGRVLGQVILKRVWRALEHTRLISPVQMKMLKVTGSFALSKSIANKKWCFPELLFCITSNYSGSKGRSKFCLFMRLGFLAPGSMSSMSSWPIHLPREPLALFV